ncbi:MAG TPA: rhodanese-like domain-containing protein [Ktedonobacterales bacterium]
MATGAIPQVDPREARLRANEAGQGSEPAVLIDVREMWEYRQVRAPEATLIPLSQFIQRFNEIPRDREVLVVCHTGQRSMQASMYLARQGYARVGNVRGGMDAWEAAGLPVERG